MRRAQQQELVADYFARGGTVRRLPTPEPIEASEVLQYLHDCSFDVYAAPRGQGEPKYVCQGAVVTQQELVSIANEHRNTRGLPPFQLTSKVH